jgi:hypothetical protein
MSKYKEKAIKLVNHYSEYMINRGTITGRKTIFVFYGAKQSAINHCQFKRYGENVLNNEAKYWIKIEKEINKI